MPAGPEGAVRLQAVIAAAEAVLATSAPQFEHAPATTGAAGGAPRDALRVTVASDEDDYEDNDDHDDSELETIIARRKAAAASAAAAANRHLMRQGHAETAPTTRYVFYFIYFTLFN